MFVLLPLQREDAPTAQQAGQRRATG